MGSLCDIVHEACHGLLCPADSLLILLGMVLRLLQNHRRSISVVVLFAVVSKMLLLWLHPDSWHGPCTM